MENMLGWLTEKITYLLNGGLVRVCKILASQTSAFVIVAVVGAYLLMLGNKETGNKVISTTVIAYLIVKVVSLAC